MDEGRNSYISVLTWSFTYNLVVSCICGVSTYRILDSGQKDKTAYIRTYVRTCSEHVGFSDTIKIKRKEMKWEGGDHI